MDKLNWHQQTLVGYLSDEDTYFYILDHWLRLRNGPKMANFGPNALFYTSTASSAYLEKYGLHLNLQDIHLWRAAWIGVLGAGAIWGNAKEANTALEIAPMRLVAGWSSETDLKKDELKFKNLKNPPFEIKKSIN